MDVHAQLYINGEWREGRGSAILESHDPYSGELLFTYRAASKEDVDDAYAAAKAAQVEWAKKSPAEVCALLDKLTEVIDEYTDRIADCVIHEAGSLPGKSRMEAKNCRFHAQYSKAFPYQMRGETIPSNVAGQDNYTFRSPKGVICVIAPWNVPFVLAIRSIIPALATGNTVVLKPSSDTPGSAFMMAEMFEKAGFPAGVFNIIVGKGSEIGDYIVEHPVPALISLTGSTEVGQHIGQLAMTGLKDVSLELGGNNFMIVLEDADLDAAATAAVHGSYSNAGQICMALNRIIVVEDVYEQFVELFVEKTKKLVPGDPAVPGTTLNPVINSGRADEIMGWVEESIASGARVALEGKREGNLIHPWVLADCTNETATCAHEVFGPVASIICAKDAEDALRIANEPNYGLSSAIYTADLYRGVNLAKRVEAGMVHVNDQSIGDEPQVMFGGEKMSGIGRFNDHWVLDKFTTDKWVSVQNGRRWK